MTATRQWNTGIVARSRIYFAAVNKVYAFRLPTAKPIRLLLLHRAVTPTRTPAPSPTPAATVTPTATPTPEQITLTARGYKVQGRHQVDLALSGATSSNVDIYRNGTCIITVPNNGGYTDSPVGRATPRTRTKYAMQAPKPVLIRRR